MGKEAENLIERNAGVAAPTSTIEEVVPAPPPTAPSPLSAPTVESRLELLRECEALIIYISRRGDVLQDQTAPPQGESRRDRLQALVEAVEKYDHREGNAERWQALVTAYAGVTAFTYGDRGVNGRSVLDTWGEIDVIGRLLSGAEERRSAEERARAWHLQALHRGERFLVWIRHLVRVMRGRRWPLTVGVILGVSALALQVAVSWSHGHHTVATTAGAAFWKFVVLQLTPLLIPACWGGLGACIFLMKRTSDRLADVSFEETRLEGDGTRIFIGIMLGVVVVEVFFVDFSKSLELGKANFGPATAAFIAGLGYKPVYAAFETLSEGLASRLKPPTKPGGGK